MFTLPEPFSKIPYHRLSYAHASPIHELSVLTAHVHGSHKGHPQIQLWAKREDQSGPLACCGNKYRKFEYIIPDIKASTVPVTTIVSEGAIQSNHTVQVASMARVLGLKCSLLLHKGIGGLSRSQDKVAFTRVGNVQLNHMLGADIHFTDESDTGDETGPLVPLLDHLRARGETPYWISSGASLHPLGGLGYTRCAFEIAAQEQDLAKEHRLYGSGKFDFIFVACGSGSTLSGLVAGFKLLEKTRGASKVQGTKRQIVGIMTSPTKPKAYHTARLLRLARGTGALIGLDPDVDISEQDIVLEDGFAGPGYGVSDGETAATLELAARSDSLILDPVYTGKVMTGLLHWARDHAGKASSPPPVNALFIHTGGTSVLSAYSDQTTSLYTTLA